MSLAPPSPSRSTLRLLSIPCVALLLSLSACGEPCTCEVEATKDACGPVEDAAGQGWDTQGKVAAVPTCGAYASPQSLAKVTEPLVDEISGIAVSRRHKDILWVHNDSGGGARVYALDSQARLRLVIKLKDADPDDWEDIALGPCVLGQPPLLWRCLYVADTGDNSKSNHHARIFRIQEPAQIPLPVEGTVTRVDLPINAWRRWTFDWPEGPRNVEALAMLPDMRAIFLTKDSTKPKTEVWRVNLNNPGDSFPERLGSLDVSTPDVSEGKAVAVTAADLDPTGRWLLVRTYKKLFLFDTGQALSAPATGGDLLIGAKRSILPNGYDAMGESVAWDPQEGYWHTSEATKHSTPRLWRVKCAQD